MQKKKTTFFLTLIAFAMLTYQNCGSQLDQDSASQNSQQQLASSLPLPPDVIPKLFCSDRIVAMCTIHVNIAGAADWDLDPSTEERVMELDNRRSIDEQTRDLQIECRKRM